MAPSSRRRLLGLGVTLLADDAVRAELAAGALVELRAPGAPLTRSWYVLTPARGPDPSAAELFRRLCLAAPQPGR